MHIADPTQGIFGANGIVAAGLPIAVGAATAAQLRADGNVAVAFFGDGAVAQGAFHEAVNLAAVWQLPVMFFCENNGYAEFSPASAQHAATLEQRAAGYGVDYVAVDGNDVVATASVMHDVVEPIRSGHGPAIVEATTYRWHGHYEGDPQRYRTTDEVEEWEARDPLLVHADRLRAEGVDDATIDALGVVDRVRARRGRRRRASAREPGRQHAWRTSSSARGPSSPSLRPCATTRRCSAPWTRSAAALEAELASDDRVFVAGIDVAAGGNVFGLTRGLHEQFGDRVRDTPISETAIDGPRGRCGDGGHASGRRADVPRLPRRVPRPVAQPGGEDAVHDRRRRADGAHRADAVRRRALVGEPALAEPGGAPRAHPRA